MCCACVGMLIFGSCSGGKRNRIDLPGETSARMDSIKKARAQEYRENREWYLEDDSLEEDDTFIEEEYEDEAVYADSLTEDAAVKPKETDSEPHTQKEDTPNVFYEIEPELNAFLKRYEKTAKPGKAMLKEGVELLKRAVDEYGKAESEAYNDPGEVRYRKLTGFVRRLYAHTPDIVNLVGVNSTDRKMHFAEFTANTAPVLQLIAYRKGSGYAVDFIKNGYYKGDYDRFNKIQAGGKDYYLLNVGSSGFSLTPLLYRMDGGKPVECKVKGDEELWTTFHRNNAKGLHLDFHPKKLVWTICQKGKKGTWQPVPGKLRIQLKQSGNGWEWVPYKES